MKTQIIEIFSAVKEKKPLIHNISNFVVMNNTANALLALGASPVMAHAIEELEEMIGISSSLVINMGTINKSWLKSMLSASAFALRKPIPWVFDPVGAGATNYRTDSALKLLKLNKPSVIRANASEIMALVNSYAQTKGVDSNNKSSDALCAAQKLVSQYQNTVSISGADDFIISTNRQTQVHNGSPIMTQVTGMGCTASALTGACLAVCQDSHLAATAAMGIMGVAGEIAKENSTGSGSFQVAFLDALYNLRSDQLNDRLQITDEK